MRIKVLYLGLVRNKTGKKEESCELADGSSLSDLLKRVAETYGGSLKGLFRAEMESRLDPTFIVTVNGVLKDPSKGEAVPLADGDTVALMTLISGG